MMKDIVERVESELGYYGLSSHPIAYSVNSKFQDVADGVKRLQSWYRRKILQSVIGGMIVGFLLCFLWIGFQIGLIADVMRLWREDYFVHHKQVISTSKAQSQVITQKHDDVRNGEK